MQIRIIAISIISSFTLYSMENNFNSRVTTDEEKDLQSLTEIKKQTPTTIILYDTSTPAHTKSKNDRKKRFKEQCEELKRQKTIAGNRNLRGSFAKGRYKQILKEHNLFSSILVKDLEELNTPECTEKQIQKTLEQVADFLT